MASNRKPLWVIVLLLLLLGGFYYFQSLAPEPVRPAAEANFIFTRHARCRMECRHITEAEVKAIYQQGKINYRKSEPNGKPDPKYAYEGRSDDGQALRIVLAKTARGWVVVTVIDINQEWSCNCP